MLRIYCSNHYGTFFRTLPLSRDFLLVTGAHSQVETALINALTKLYMALDKALHKLKKALNKLKKIVNKDKASLASLSLRLLIMF